ncbi:MAG: aminotransferase class I/II-fold pyridoxal phosphate-dependent enzyme [Candidatus Aminicenantes bacterium]|nr:aminotransferase class I/II-fold pyridoxal phosphate-dependent enzyme [Candidatus Aminicenantes bacterium]NIM84604.1 aminotransferase class I/II-fold pyridoxal phosphate-dependent enzyme [Candidatus Aminicenantes bacterium]NIN24126.1 aminotransferase class I/II-fold pyridoxal phosphate-dependent enzyme [Candidatus Aminicenantes bacterium]NIN47832.1 aminotransferase class I/II-fold pyridoxal phosphate-dependent enzyme [Candidatus Aminicenantes bacterium]NIN90770.1 aminotransferase class I/II-
MEFIDLHMQQERIRDKIEANIKKVLDHGKYIMGPEIEKLEKKLAGYVGIRYAVGVASGTDALLMALMTYNIGPGDAVFTSPFTFIATAEVIQLLGATPVFVDIQPDTFNIDPEKLETVIRETAGQGQLNTKGIIPVDLFGQPADYDEINAVARKYNLFVLQDAAQSFGASYKGAKACSHGDVAATSFFPAKPLGCYGDGGMVFTDNPGIHDKLISIRVHGKGTNKYDNIRVGINGRLDTIQAAVLLAKLEIFAEEIQLRQEVAKRYSDGLKDFVTVPLVKEYNISAWAQYSILHPQRDAVIARLKEQNIPTAIYYPLPLHLQEAFTHLGYKKGDFPISEKTAQEIFSIPMHPYLDIEDQEKIMEIIAQ